MAEDAVCLDPEKAQAKYPGPRDFVHLHNHSIFSPLDGVATPAEYIKKCVEYEMPAIAITDHGQLSSFPDAYLASKEHGVKFIPGCEIYYNDFHPQLVKFQESGVKWADLRKSDPDTWERLRRNRHLTVLAKNEIGYRNLIHVTSNAWEKGFYYKPRIWFDCLKERGDGLVILSGCLNGPASHNVGAFLEARASEEFTDDEAKIYFKRAIAELKRFKERFGENFYAEVQMPGPDLEISIPIFRVMLQIAKNLGIKPVLTNDSHFIESTDFQTQKMMMAIDQNLTIDSPDIFGANSPHQFLKTRAQLRQTFFEYYSAGVNQADFEEACDNTVEVAEKCKTFNPDLEPKLPDIENAKATLVKLVMGKLREMGLYDNPKKYFIDAQWVTHKEQAEIELKRIIEKGFASYFLITMNLVQYSKEQGWDVGPGRGSAGGSLVSYLLGIHNINPLKFGLSFVRFMSPSRGGNMLKASME